MEQHQITESKKRSIQDVEYQQLLGRFRSKQDFIHYLDKRYVSFTSPFNLFAFAIM